MKKMLAMTFLALAATTAAYADDMNMNAPGNQTIIANDPASQAVNPTAPTNVNGTTAPVPGTPVMPGPDNMSGSSAAMPGSDNMSAGTSDTLPGSDNMSGTSDTMSGTDNMSAGASDTMPGSDNMTGGSDNMGVPGQ